MDKFSISTQHKLSEEARIVTYESGAADIVKSLPIGMHGRMMEFVLPLSVDEMKQLHRLMLFEDVPVCDELLTCKPVEQSDEKLTQCPACKRLVHAWQLWRSPIGEIFCEHCRKEECQCRMPREECCCSEEDV